MWGVNHLSPCVGINLTKGSQRELEVWEGAWWFGRGLRGDRLRRGLGSGKGLKASRKGAWQSRRGLEDSGSHTCFIF